MKLEARKYLFEIWRAGIAWVAGAHYWRLAHWPDIASGTPGAQWNARLPMLVARKVRV